MDPSRPLEIFRFALQEKGPFLPCKSFIDQACSVKLGGHWLLSFLRLVNKRKCHFVLDHVVRTQGIWHMNPGIWEHSIIVIITYFCIHIMPSPLFVHGPLHIKITEYVLHKLKKKGAYTRQPCTATTAKKNSGCFKFHRFYFPFSSVKFVKFWRFSWS